MHKNYKQTKLSSFTYKAVIRQEPQRGRMCGLGEQVSKRMLDPPLILEISFEGKQPTDTEMQNLAVSLTCHVSLKSAENNDQSVVMLGQKSLLPTLLGTTSMPATVLKDVADGKSKLFFVFHDLGVRLQGKFILECKTVDMARFTVSTIQTGVISIFPPQLYPGILESTPLSKCFYKQGIPIRSGVHSKKNTQDGAFVRKLPAERGYDPFNESF